MAAPADWSGGAAYFQPPAGTVSQLPDGSGGASDAAWNGFWDALGMSSPLFGGWAPEVPVATDAIGGAVSSATSAVSGAASSVGNWFDGVGAALASTGKWLLVGLALIVLVLFLWKV